MSIIFNCLAVNSIMILTANIFSFPATKTWEFVSEAPIRSVFPLYLVYGLPMALVQLGYAVIGIPSVKPVVVFRLLRLSMFLLSCGLGDRAVWELAGPPTRRWSALLLCSSSYVTWTWQVHTFSNSIETVLVLWALVLMKSIVNNKVLNDCNCVETTANLVPSDPVSYNLQFSLSFWS